MAIGGPAVAHALLLAGPRDRAGHVTSVLVTGGNGDLGSSVVRGLAEAGLTVVSADLAVPAAPVPGVEHVVMDVEHAHLLMQVARTYATTDSTRRAILRGAKESLMIDRVYRGHLADMVEALP